LQERDLLLTQEQHNFRSKSRADSTEAEDSSPSLHSLS